MCGKALDTDCVLCCDPYKGPEGTIGGGRGGKGGGEPEMPVCCNLAS